MTLQNSNNYCLNDEKNLSLSHLLIEGLSFLCYFFVHGQQQHFLSIMVGCNLKI